MLEHLQPEEQPLLAHEARVRAAAEVPLPLLLVQLEEVVQHTRARAQEARRFGS